MSEPERQALVISLRLLTVAPKSRKQLQQKLEEKGFDREVIARVLGRLEKDGLLNDRAYAQSVLQSFSSRRQSGRKRIAFELKKRGLSDSLVEEVLEKYSGEEEREKALGLAGEKWERWRRIEERKRRKKVYDFLVRRGFDFALSREVIEEVERASGT